MESVNNKYNQEVKPTEFKVQTETQQRISSIYFNMSGIHGVNVRARVLPSIQKDKKGMEYSWTVGDFPVSQPKSVLLWVSEEEKNLTDWEQDVPKPADQTDPFIPS